MTNPIDLVIFGATGDLTLRKLLPALYRADRERHLADETQIFLSCRSTAQIDSYLEKAQQALQQYLGDEEFASSLWQKFSQRLHPIQLDLQNHEGDWPNLPEQLNAQRPRVFYLAIAPALFANCCERLAALGLNTPQSRVVLEKPIGYDRDSAEQINAAVAQHFSEQQIYRIDHYLGKETVQNLLVLRFSNRLFENLWDRQSIDHIQISISETVGLEGRAGFYDDAGALRDMVQNHLLQLLCLVAMEPPNQLNSDNIRTEKLKVLQSLRPINRDDVRQHTVRGQYVSGEAQQQLVPGYLEELGRSQSFCETFVALRLFLDNWRWAGVPFYLRTGKRLKKRCAEIVVQFKPVSHAVYPAEAGVMHANQLVIQLQPQERIQLRLTSKYLGESSTRLQPVLLDLNLSGDCHDFHSDAYKRLLLDVFAGDASLFIHRDEIDCAWRFVDPIIQGWREVDYQPELYRSGSWGPDSANKLLAERGHTWHQESRDQQTQPLISQRRSDT